MVDVDRADVVVIGGGPAGSATATRLARAGVDVVLLDKASFPREKACAEYLSPGVVDALEDLGALDLVRGVPHRVLPGMDIVAQENLIPLQFSADRTAGNLALGIKRSILDQQLLELAAMSGVEVHEKTRVTAPLTDGRRVTGVRFKTGDEERSIASKFVVAADGLHSTVARFMDLDRPQRWPDRLGLVARFTGLPGGVDHGQMHIGHGIYCGMSPVTESETNVSLVVPMGSKLPSEPTVEFFERSIRRLPGIRNLLGDARRITPVRGIGPLGKRARRIAGPGYLLVGDAAGFFDPLTGEGIHRALLGGMIAAQSVMRALERDDRRPVGYGSARRRAFTDKQRVCQIIQLLISSPRALEYASSRAASRSAVAEPLSSILGDYQPARQAFRGKFLWNLLRP